MNRSSHDNKLFAWKMLAPAALLILIIFTYPIVSNLILSFTDQNLIRRGFSWVGWANFAKLLRDRVFWVSLYNTVVWTAGSVGLQFVVGTGAALLLFYSGKRVQGFFRTALVVPWMMPVIVIAIMWRWLLNDLYGIIPYYLAVWGFTRDMISVFSTGNGSMIAVILIDVWRAFPLIMLSVLAGLQAIPREQFEVAVVEGASRLQTLRYVILPNVTGILATMAVLRTIWTFNDFDRVYLLTGGGPGISTQTLPILAYKTAWSSLRVGEAAALSVLMLIVLFVATSFYLRLSRSKEEQ